MADWWPKKQRSRRSDSSSAALLDAHRLWRRMRHGSLLLCHRRDQSGHDAVEQELGTLDGSSEFLRERSGLAIEPVLAGDQALPYHIQFDVRRCQDPLLSRFI